MAATAIVEVPDDSTKPRVFLPNFTNGRLEEPKGMKFAVFDNQEGKSRKRHFVAETENLTYTSTGIGETVSRGGCSSKYMVAIYDRANGKITLHDAQMFNVQPEIQDGDIEDGNEKDRTFRQKADELTSTFGGSKKKRAMLSRLRNESSKESLTEAVSSAAKEAMSQPLDLNRDTSPAEDDVNSLVPPHNKEASTWNEAYPLEGIISPRELEDCKMPGKIFADASRETITSWQEEKRYPAFILDCLLRLPMDSEARLRKAACLLYLHYLIFMYYLKAPDLKKRDVMPPDMPPIVRKVLMDRFTISATPVNQRVRVCMPARMKDKLICYILVLSLILEENSLKFEMLLPALKVSSTKIRKHLNMLGMKVQQQRERDILGNDSKIVNLAFVSLPLKLTTIKPPPRRTK